MSCASHCWVTILSHSERMSEPGDSPGVCVHISWLLLPISQVAVCSQALLPYLQGAELIPQLTSGDVIVSAELVSGQNRLANGPATAA